MMTLSSIKQNFPKAYQLLEGFLHSELPSRVFLFYGDTKIDKNEIALLYAKEILSKASHFSCQAKLDSMNHPDLHSFKPESSAGFYTIDTIRKLNMQSAYPPLESRKKVFLLYNFEKAADVASSALLKTLEEPNEDTIIILTTNDLGSLLPTIVSRCVKIPFYQKLEAVSIDEITENLKNLASVSASKLSKLANTFTEKSGSYEGDFLALLLSTFLKKHQYSSCDIDEIYKYFVEASEYLQNHLKPKNVFLNLLLQIQQIDLRMLKQKSAAT